MQGDNILDRFTRNYSIGLGTVIALSIALWAISSWDPGASRLNKVLEGDAELAAYPYQFRVASLQDAVATLKSPRSSITLWLFFSGSSSHVWQERTRTIRT